MYLLLPLLLPVVQETAPEPRPVLVPLGRSIELDGRLAPEEWQGAARHELAAGGELFLQHDERYLYLALRSPKPGLMHAYLFVEEEIRVHHASAALGTAIYQLDDLGAWQLTQSFPPRDGWALRDPSLAPERRAERQEFLAQQHWVASNSTMGPKECEFILERKLFGPATRIALAYMGDAMQPLLWPKRLADGCAKRELLMGAAPSTLAFAPQTWERLEFAPAPATEKQPLPK